MNIPIRIHLSDGYIEFVKIGENKHKLYELLKIEVDNRYRRIGIGKKLFKKMLSQIKYRKLFCTTHSSNKTAQLFYESMGMKMEAVLPSHYYKGESEIVYGLYKK